jgi:c-di-GMP-related signal transduction protein
METFIARQPIFDRQMDVYGYELLFRSSLENFYNSFDQNQATLNSIVASYLFPGSSNIAVGKRAFINFTRDNLINDRPFLLPQNSTVIEVLETVDADAPVIEACRKVKAAGYTIALDDFVYHPDKAPLIELADIIKVDFLATSVQEQREMVRRFAPRGIALCAEKVETWDVLQQALDLGYSYFQGYFFGKPAIISGHSIPANKLGYLHLIREMNSPNLQFAEIERLIRGDLSLTYKLFRYLNSAAFGFRREIKSIRQTLSLLGERGLKRWVTLVALVELEDECVSELVSLALTRAFFCESIAAEIGLGPEAEDLYLLGIFSCLDAILQRPLPDVLRELCVASHIEHALLGGDGQLNDIYKCVLAYEDADWEKSCELAAKLNMKASTLPGLYRNAVTQAGEIINIGCNAPTKT